MCSTPVGRKSVGFLGLELEPVGSCHVRAGVTKIFERQRKEPPFQLKCLGKADFTLDQRVCSEE